MRVALVGWNVNASWPEALAGLGVEVVVYEATTDDQGAGSPLEVASAGWTRVRCPYRAEGSVEARTLSFQASVIDRDGLLANASGAGFDVIASLDPPSRVAAGGLAVRYPGALVAGRIVTSDAADDHEAPTASTSGYAWQARVDLWFCDHPRLWPFGARLIAPSRDLKPGATVRMIAGGIDADPRESSNGNGLDVASSHDREPRARSESDGLRVACWLPSQAGLDPLSLGHALAALNRLRPGLVAVPMVGGLAATRLEGFLRRQGVAFELVSTGDAAWNSALAGADVVVGPSSHPTTEAMRDEAARWGRPIVLIRERAETSVIQRAIDRTLSAPEASRRRVEISRRIARHRRSPESMAADWVRIVQAVQDERIRHVGASLTPPEPNQVMLPRFSEPARFSGTRLWLTPIGSRELYAAWSLRREDVEAAVGWLGRDAIHARPILRLWDITAIQFDGTNAHEHRDVPLGEIALSATLGQRTIRLDLDGRSLVASLGLAGPSGGFVTLAHVPPIHLPADQPTTSRPTRWLRPIRAGRLVEAATSS